MFLYAVLISCGREVITNIESSAKISGNYIRIHRLLKSRLFLYQIEEINVQRETAMKQLDEYQESVKTEAGQCIAKLNSDREEVDALRKRLHELSVRAADYEVVQQYNQMRETADRELRKVTGTFSPYQKLPQMRCKGKDIHSVVELIRHNQSLSPRYTTALQYHIKSG